MYTQSGWRARDAQRYAELQVSLKDFPKRP
jgi:hypothetical protein